MRPKDDHTHLVLTNTPWVPDLLFKRSVMSHYGYATSSIDKVEFHRFENNQVHEFIDETLSKAWSLHFGDREIDLFEDVNLEFINKLKPIEIRCYHRKIKNLRERGIEPSLRDIFITPSPQGEKTVRPVRSAKP